MTEPSTNWTPTAPKSTNFAQSSSISTNYSQNLDSLNGKIMDDTVVKMDDSTYTLDDAKSNQVFVNSTNWGN